MARVGYRDDSLHRDVFLLPKGRAEAQLSEPTVNLARTGAGSGTGGHVAVTWIYK